MQLLECLVFSIGLLVNPYQGSSRFRFICVSYYPPLTRNPTHVCWIIGPFFIWTDLRVLQFLRMSPCLNWSACQPYSGEQPYCEHVVFRLLFLYTSAFTVFIVSPDRGLTECDRLQLA